MKPSAELVLDALRRHPEGLTALMALEEARCLRLAARIADLKAEGHCIEADLVTVGSRGRGLKRIAVYRLIEQEQMALAL